MHSIGLRVTGRWIDGDCPGLVVRGSSEVAMLYLREMSAQKWQLPYGSEARRLQHTNKQGAHGRRLPMREVTDPSPQKATKLFGGR